MNKKVYILTILVFVMATNAVFSQTTTKKLSYQAVVRNAANELVVNQNLSVEITILDAEQHPQYKETHATVPTNQNGLLWLWVGDGTPTLGTMANVVWKDATIRSVFTLPDGSTVTQNTPVTAMPHAFFADEVDTVFLQNYLTTHNYGNDDYVTHQELNDTLNHYYTNEQVDAALIPYATNAHLNDTLSHYLMKEVQVLSISHDTIFLTGGSFVVLPKGFSGSYHDLVDTPTNVSAFTNDAGYLTEHQSLEGYVTQDALNDTLSYYTTTGNIDTLLGAYFDSTQVKTAIHDTAEAIRAAIPASQVNADWNATSGPAEILHKPNLSVYATKDELNDYEKKSDLCGDVKECIDDTLKHYTTSDKIDTLLGAYFDSTKVKTAIHDTASALRALMGDAANDGLLMIVAAGDTTRFTANQATNDTVRLNKFATKDTLAAYYDTADVKQMLKPYLKANELCDSIVKCDVIKDMRDSLDNAFDTLKYYYTSKKTNDTLKHYYDTAYVNQTLKQYLKSGDLCDSIEKNCTNVALKNKDNLFTLRNQFDSTVFFKDATYFDSTAYFNERAYFDEDVNVKGDVIFKGYNYYYNVNNFYEHDAIVLIDEAVNPNTLGPVQSTQDQNLNRRLAVNYNDLMVVYDTLKKTAQNGNAALAARIVADSNRLVEFKGKVHNDSLALAERIDTIYSHLCDSVMNCTDIKTMQTDIAANKTNIGLNKQAIIDSSAHIRNEIKNGQITIAVNRSTTTTETTVTNPTFGVNQEADQTVTINIPQETTVNNGQLTIVAAGDTTRFTANQAANDTMRLDKFATKEALKDTAKTLRGIICDSATACITKALADPTSEINYAIDTIALHHVSDSTRMVFDTLHKYYATKDTLKNFVNKLAIRDSVNKIVTDSLRKGPSEMTRAIDSIARHHISDSTRMVFDTLHKYYATKDTLKNFVNKLAIRDSVNNIVKDSLAAPNSAINIAIDTIARHNISDSTRMVFDTLHKYYATKDTLKNFVNKLAIRDSVNKIVTDSLRKGPSEMTRAIDSIARHHISDSTRMVFDTLHTYYATKDTLKNFVNKLAIRDSVNKVVTDSLRKGPSEITRAIDSIARHNISDSTRMVFDTLHKYYATKKALKDTATAIRNDICDSATTCITKALADANSEINRAIDTIARHNIHDTAVAIRALIPTVPTNVSAFINDAKYVNNASCDSLDFCALMAKVNALANSMGEFNNTINDMQHTIDSLEGVIDALSSLLPKVTLTTDKTTAPIGSGDVASVICTATLKNASGYTLYWKVDGTDSTSNHNTPFTVNFTTVGTHKIVCTAKQEGSPDIKDSVTITITKGTPTVNVTLATGLVYTGAPQALVTAGSTTGGTLQYKLNDGAYSTDIPEASAVGSYTVSYKVVGNDNWNDVDETSEDVTIAKMPINPTVSITGWTSCEPANIPSVTGNTGNAPVTYEYKVNGADDNTYGATIPVSAGEYTIRATVAETANYSAGVATADFTIAAGSGCEEPSGTPATILVAPTATPGTITSCTTTPLVTEGQAENGTMMYAVTTSAQPQLSDFSTTVPTAAALTAGTCYVWYYAQGIIPYINSPIAGPIEVTVTPPPFSVGSNKKVYFAPANLQASTSDCGAHWTWQFAPNEWDYVGETFYHNTRVQGAGTVKFSGEGKVDLFSWVGASNTTWSGELGTTLNAAMHGIVDATSTTDIFGSSASDVLKSDWGNTINDGHNWRTPTSEEWVYLLATRASGSTVPGKVINNNNNTHTNITVNNARYTLARINTDGTAVRGLIIFPDGITIEESEIGRGVINGDIGSASLVSNEDVWVTRASQCTTAQWAALSAKGCVFLPTAGYRYHNPGESNPGVSGVTNAQGYAGQYWSSSPSGTTTAYFVLFKKDYVDPRSSDHLLTISERRFGLSVRLVRDAE